MRSALHPSIHQLVERRYSNPAIAGVILPGHGLAVRVHDGQITSAKQMAPDLRHLRTERGGDRHGHAR